MCDFRSEFPRLSRACGELKVTGNEYLLLACLHSYRDRDGKAWPSQERIREETGLSEKQIKTAVRGLKQKSILTVTPRRRLSAVYDITPFVNAAKAILGRPQRADLKPLERPFSILDRPCRDPKGPNPNVRVNLGGGTEPPVQITFKPYEIRVLEPLRSLPNWPADPVLEREILRRLGAKMEAEHARVFNGWVFACQWLERRALRVREWISDHPDRAPKEPHWFYKRWVERDLADGKDFDTMGVSVDFAMEPRAAYEYAEGGTD